jgi:NADH-quinone oxidoreductase subunit N
VSAADFYAIAPLLVLTVAIVVLMLLIAWRRSHAMAAWVSGGAFTCALLALVVVAAPHSGRPVTPLLVIDGYALFYIGLVLAAGIAVTIISHGYLQAGAGAAGAELNEQSSRAGTASSELIEQSSRAGAASSEPIEQSSIPRTREPRMDPGLAARASRAAVPREEYYLLLLLATLGAATTVAADHFAAFFLGLETLSISLLGLIAYPQTVERPLEASVKYLVLSGVASAFLLFGIALVYAETGSLAFSLSASLPAAETDARGIYWLTGVALILVGIGFKLSVIPFHMWAPDVYEGAPAPVTAFLAVVSKCAVFALLLRYFLTAEAFVAANLAAILSVVAVLSMIGGNLAALLQDNVKRMLAYSSIAHLGYALVAFVAGGALAVEAVSIYLAMYAITTLGAFAIVAMLSAAGRERDTDTIEDYRGLFWIRPGLALAFAAMLLSLAGIPLTLGFIGKFYAVNAGVSADSWILISALIVGSVISLYYYLRLIVAMLSDRTMARARSARRVSWPSGAVVTVLTIALLGLGVFPGPLVSLIRTSAVDLAEHPTPRITDGSVLD